MAKGTRRSKNFRASTHIPVRNEAWASAMEEVRRSSAASKHVPLFRKGTKSSRKNAAINDSKGV